jgi:hypothetical protein
MERTEAQTDSRQTELANMTPERLLEEAQSGQLKVEARENRLIVHGPREAEHNLVQALLSRKRELMPLLRATSGESLPQEAAAPNGVNDLVTPVAPAVAPADPHEAFAALRDEIDEIERRDFPGGFPLVLARCIGHYLAGPTVPPAEGAAAWWAGAGRQVMGMIERSRQQPSKGKPT